jgi:hypothetical protein
MEGNMLALQAGIHPHIITRPCRDRDEAERWALALIQRGFAPVTIDGVDFKHHTGEPDSLGAEVTGV